MKITLGAKKARRVVNSLKGEAKERKAYKHRAKRRERQAIRMGHYDFSVAPYTERDVS